MINFSYLDTTEVINIPSQKNSGLYSGVDSLDNEAWGGNYLNPKILPNGENYSSQFFSKSIAPYDDRNSGRYGNNSIGSR